MLTYRDVAKKWNVPVRTVRNLVADGRLKAARLTQKSIRFRSSDVEAYEQKALA